jgi:hypothetical protein
MNDRAIAIAHAMVQDPFPTPQLDYSVCRTESSLTSYLYSGSDGYHDINPRILIANDTESLPDEAVYCLTFSVRPGSGRLVYVHDTPLIDRYRQFLHAHHPHQLFHNYLHDIIPFDTLNLPVNKFTDTMVRAYNLCLGGGGDAEDGESRAGRGLLSLKVLAYRHCHMRMTSFLDTVYPHSIPYAHKWLCDARDLVAPLPKKICNCSHNRDKHIPRGKTGKLMGQCGAIGCTCDRYKERKPLKESGSREISLLYTKLNRLIVSIENHESDPESGSPIDPWKRYKGWHDCDHENLEGALGEMPKPSIAHVPENELVHYAVRDADATLRLYLHMRRLKPWLFYH